MEALKPPELIPCKGLSFLTETCGSRRFFIPEYFTEEQRAFGDTAETFMLKEVIPSKDDLEDHKEGLQRSLMKKAGELGLLMIDIEEEYGGLGLDKVTSIYIAEKMALNASFAAIFGAHVGIGTLPIVFFGTEEQKKRYLPKLATAEIISAYCLTEADAGSDAMNIKTKAVRDGDYFILDGTKQFITNGGVADLFIVFAKVDGDKFSAFIVERGTEGLSLSPEENKMGIKGSSTCSVILDNARVEKRNLIGEIGKGHKIAFNILNIGRLKLGASVVGGAKDLIKTATKYAIQRRQFGQPIANFGLIREKLARMACLTYATESAAYRTGGAVDLLIKRIKKGVADYNEQVMKAIEEFSIEASICKVFGSEALDQVVDEALQIHGGYGYIKDYGVEGFYRDSRINRIFEGTNEINRLIISGTLFKRVMKKEFPIFSILNDIQSFFDDPDSLKIDDGPLSSEIRDVEVLKRLTIFTANKAMQRYMMFIQKEQETLATISDMLIDVYVADSTIGRTLQILEAVEQEKCRTLVDMTRVIVNRAYLRVIEGAKRLFCSMTSGDELSRNIALIDRVAPYRPVNLIALNRSIAEKVIEREGYPV